MNTVPHRSTSFRHFKGMSLRDHYFEVPLDYADPDAGTLEVFAREVVASGKRDDEDLPWMVFFQGGPGFGANRPADYGGWVGEVLKSTPARA